MTEPPEELPQFYGICSLALEPAVIKKVTDYVKTHFCCVWRTKITLATKRAGAAPDFCADWNLHWFSPTFLFPVGCVITHIFMICVWGKELHYVLTIFWSYTEVKNSFSLSPEYFCIAYSVFNLHTFKVIWSKHKDSFYPAHNWASFFSLWQNVLCPPEKIQKTLCIMCLDNQRFYCDKLSCIKNTYETLIP